MIFSSRRFISGAVASSLIFLGGLQSVVAATDGASDYPSRAVTVVVGYPPGGATDIIARLIASKLSESMGKTFIVENKAGAGSNIGTDRVVRADPDGYTLLVETIANAINMSVYKNLNYNTQKDLSPIVQFMFSPSVLVVNPSLPVKNLNELIALAKAEPGKLTYASSGIGSSPHLGGEMLKLRAGINVLHIPYKGAAPAMMDVIGGTVSMGFMTLLGAMPQIQRGELRPIAVATAKRLPDLPNVPTIDEAGLPDFEVVSWNGLAAPAGTPDAIIQKLNHAVNAILKMPDVKEKLEGLGAEPVGGTSAQFTRYINAETAKWAEVVKGAEVVPN